MSIVLKGSRATAANVDASKKTLAAQRNTPDVVSSHTIGIATTIPARQAAGGEIIQVRNAGSNLLVLTGVSLYTQNTAAAATSTLTYEAFICRNWSVLPAGSNFAIGPNRNVKNSSLPDLQIRAGVALTVGTKTIDTQPFGIALAAPSNSANTAPYFNIQHIDRNMFNNQRSPIILAQNEGIVFINTNTSAAVVIGLQAVLTFDMYKANWFGT